MNKIYYISQGDTVSEHIENIRKVCEAGCKLVQLRLKEIDENEYAAAAKQAKQVCMQFGSKLIVNDSVSAMLASDAYGVHLGKNDQSPLEARKEAGKKIIGGTANTLEGCLQLIQQGVDYIGLGPFRFTETKKVLDPILGFEGYRNIISALATAGHTTPIYAIGGINTIDISAILETGVYGVSVSGLLTDVEDLKERMEEIQKAI